MKYALTIIVITTLFPVSSVFSADLDRTYKDWVYGCENSNNGDSFCSIRQLVTDKSNDTPMLLAAVGYPGQSSIPDAIFTLPLGVKLTKGVQVHVDNNAPVSLNYSVCEAIGCRVTLKLDESWLGQFKAGNKAYIQFTSPQNQAIAIPVSLSGFTAAMRALKN